MYIYICIGVVVVITIWTAGSYFAIATIETPSYTVTEKNDGYELRKYEAYLVAETEVTGTYHEASSAGFRIIADYIFGNNSSSDKISMTSPVVEERSEKIAMTAPVINTMDDTETRTISFILPSTYTLETLPKPNNSQVTITAVPAHTVAALRFTWYPTASRVEQKKALLKQMLERDNLTSTGSVQVARYNPPLSMPLVLRNEILIPVTTTQ